MDNVWTNLGNRLETAWKRPTRPNSKRPKDGEIIDEEKSVRWNREEVVRRQKAWDAECSRLKKAQNAEIEHISEAIELQIQEDSKPKRNAAFPKRLQPSSGKKPTTVATPMVSLTSTVPSKTTRSWLLPYSQTLVERKENTMKLNEYLAKNAVKLMIKGSGEKNPTRQTNDLGMYDYVENLESVLGKMVWICDYRANADPTKKPIRNIKPTPVVVTDAKETSKTIYYSPVYFRPVNRGKISSTVIAPLDNTGYRCCSGTSVNIFYTKEECVKCYREQVRQANEIYEKEKARIIKEFDARMQILNDSLTPFNDVPQSDYTVVAKMDVTNDSLGYNEKNRHFYLETTRTMIPTRYTIEMLKMQALIGLADELRANTTWQKGVPFRILIRTTVFVDGIEDVSQATTESQTITL